MGGGPPGPKVLSGVILAGLATVGSGLVLGPEAPLIALGSGVAVLTVSLARRDFPSQALMIIAAAGSFSAVSFIFESPLLAAVLLIEATGWVAQGCGWSWSRACSAAGSGRSSRSAWARSPG